jgi:hypothetical protein
LIAVLSPIARSSGGIPPGEAVSTRIAVTSRWLKGSGAGCAGPAGAEAFVARDI